MVADTQQGNPHLLVPVMGGNTTVTDVSVAARQLSIVIDADTRPIGLLLVLPPTFSNATNAAISTAVWRHFVAVVVGTRCGNLSLLLLLTYNAVSVLAKTIRCCSRWHAVW